MSQVPLTPLFPTPTQNGYNNDHLPPSFPPNTMSTTAHGHGHGHVNHGHNHHPHTHNHPHQSHPHSHNQNIQYLRSNSGDTDPHQSHPHSHKQNKIFMEKHGHLLSKEIINTIKDVISQNPVHIKIPSTDDWDKILQSLLFKIKNKKFRFLSKMDDSQWSIQINGQTIDKTNGNAFKTILSSIPPIPLVEIIAHKQEISKYYLITVHHKDQQFDCKLFGDKDKWDEETFKEFKQTIAKQFDLEYEFILYEMISGKAVNIDDIDDISESLNDKSLQLDLFVKITVKMNKCKVIFGKKSFNWMPPNIDNDDEKQWNDNYISLLHEIKKHFNVDPDDMECNIGCGDDILSLWKQIVDDDDKYIAEINVYVETQGESEYKLYNEQIDESSFPPSLYRFNSKDICNKIQQWIFPFFNGFTEAFNIEFISGCSIHDGILFLLATSIQFGPPGILFYRVAYKSLAVLIAVITLGKYTEKIAKGKTSQALDKLMDLAPSVARLVESWENDNDSIYMLNFLVQTYFSLKLDEYIYVFL